MLSDRRGGDITGNNVLKHLKASELMCINEKKLFFIIAIWLMFTLLHDCV